MQNDRYVVVKLTSAEEIVAHLIHEDDYDIRVLFPMLVKKVPRVMNNGQIGESITLAPYTYFSADDEYTFQRNQIIFLKDLDPQYEKEYNQAIDDFVNVHTPNPEPYDPEEIAKLTEKLNNLFREHVKSDEELEELPKIVLNPSKTIH